MSEVITGSRPQLYTIEFIDTEYDRSWYSYDRLVWLLDQHVPEPSLRVSKLTIEHHKDGKQQILDRVSAVYQVQDI